jgi:hypothetical protein
MFRILTAVATMVSTEMPWWMGVSTKLVQKTTLVEEASDPLPVYTKAQVACRRRLERGRCMWTKWSFLAARPTPIP